MEQDAIFWNRIAEKYSRQPVADEASYRKKLEITRKLLTKEMQVLELGCGTGSTAIAHAPFVKHIRAVDISPEMLAIARTKADAAGITNISFECAAIDALRVADQNVEMVMMHSILHLLEDRGAALAKVHAMLKPGGWLVSSTMCMGDAMWLLKPVLPIMRSLGKAPRVVRFFTAKRLVKETSDAGFEIHHQWQPSRRKALFVVAKKV